MKSVSYTHLDVYKRQQAYGLTEQIELLNGNSLQVFNRLTRQSQKDIRKVLDENPDNYKDPAYLDKVLSLIHI